MSNDRTLRKPHHDPEDGDDDDDHDDDGDSGGGGGSFLPQLGYFSRPLPLVACLLDGGASKESFSRFTGDNHENSA